ncbi:hypothetical protein DRP04_04795 [Archaeoglobales archaeon]|nr:MAG: hypothetical protein DRP04_04795 [Archaeoglobales archaeon]
MLFGRRIPVKVEERWIEILRSEGLEEEKAENVVAWICSDARLMTGKPDREAVEIVKEILDEEIDLKKLGIEDDESVKEEMLRELETEISTTPIPYKEEEKVPALRSPKLSLVAEVEPEDVVILNILENNWELIQKDFEEIGLEGVLKRFARAVVKGYENLLKLAIFGSYDEHTREILYKALVKGRVKEIVRKMRMREEE